MNINLPEFDAKLRRSRNGKIKIYDQLRAKYVALTPEEWVRQHFVNFLITYRGYQPTFMANEIGLKQNGNMRRCDTVIFDRSAQPAAIIEYKASNISVTESVFDQIVRYNMVLNVKWLIVSNGLQHYCCKVDKENNRYTFVKDIPTYEELLSC